MLRNAFTLIELLVVIAIIAVLSGLCMGTLGIVRGMAQSTNCISNLRQMQTANLTYAQENRGYFVCIYYLTANGAKLNPWRSNSTFLAYFTDDMVTNGDGNKVSAKLLCPTVRHVVRASGTGLTGLELSYGYNTQNPGRLPGNVGPTVRSVGSGNLITFVDALDWEITNFFTISSNYLTAVPALKEGVFSQNTVAFRHRKNANVVLGDGSAFGRGYAVLKDWGPTTANGKVRYWNP